MDTLSFDNGDEMPILGLGTWKSDPGEVYDAVKVALEAGYRHVDCAPIYGNELEVGNALSDAVSAGVADRDDLWVTSKLWNDCHDPEHVRPALEQTLDDLQLNTLDLYLIHWPVALQHGVDFPEQPDDFIPLQELPLAETWAAMEELKREGLVRHIGVSNFSVQKIQSLIDATGMPPEMSQIEMHPYLQQPDMLDFAEEENIHLTAYSPLGSQDRPQEVKADDEPNLFEDPSIQNIAEKHGASEAQVLISWAIHRGTAVIPKSVTPAHIKDNLAAAELSLTEEDMQAIAELDRHRRYLDGSIWTFDGSPYSTSTLWDE